MKILIPLNMQATAAAKTATGKKGSAEWAVGLVDKRHKEYSKSVKGDKEYSKDYLVYSIPNTRKFVKLDEVVRFIENFEGDRAAQISSIPKSSTKGDKVNEGSWLEPTVDFDIKTRKWVDAEV